MRQRHQQQLAGCASSTEDEETAGAASKRTRIGLILGSGRPRSLAVSSVGLFFCGEVGRNLRSPAAEVHPVHCLTRRDVALYKRERRLASLQWHQATSIEVVSAAIRVIRPNRGRSLFAHATKPRTFWGTSRRWRRRSHGGVTVGISDDAGKCPLVVVSVR